MIAFVHTKGIVDTVLVYAVLVLANAYIWITSGVLITDSVPRNIRGRIMIHLCQGIPGGGYA